MLDREDLRLAIRKIVEQRGLDLFDIDFPVISAPTLRIYVWRLQKLSSELANGAEEKTMAEGSAGSEKRGVTLDECAQVSRSISDWLETANPEGSDNWLLEVSSPGVNRRLRSKEHFESAIGERVKLKVRIVPELEQALDSTADSADPAAKSVGGDAVRQGRVSLVGKILGLHEAGLVLQRDDEVVRSKGTGKKRAKKGAGDETKSAAGTVSPHGQVELLIPLGAIEEARVDFKF